MKIVTFGNKIKRFALIVMKCDRSTKESVDNTITFYYSDDLKELSKLELSLREVSMNSPHYLDIKTYDYKEMHYVRGY